MNHPKTEHKQFLLNDAKLNKQKQRKIGTKLA